jgi:hypothetical protein
MTKTPHSISERVDEVPMLLAQLEQVAVQFCHAELLYVYDCKMGTLKTGALIQSVGDYYWASLPAIHLLVDQLEAYLAPVSAMVTLLIPIAPRWNVPLASRPIRGKSQSLTRPRGIIASRT